MRNLIEDPQANRKILTYESPIEFVYDRVEKISSVVSQAEIPRHLPSFAAGVRNALRRKPHAILVGEARDQETISAVMEAAMTGHPVYTTLHGGGGPIPFCCGTIPSDKAPRCGGQGIGQPRGQ